MKLHMLSISWEKPWKSLRDVQYLINIYIYICYMISSAQAKYRKFSDWKYATKCELSKKYDIQEVLMSCIPMLLARYSQIS